jgi:ACS family hexuronate transporter-like MFS transporter
MKTYKINGLRWYIAFLLFLATVICYIDRLTISTLKPVICEDLALTNQQYSYIMNWFLVSYMIFQTIFGGLYDKWGTKKTFSWAIVIWSLSAILHAFAKGVRGFSVYRFMLGVGEGGNWPGSIKAIAEWFPARQRAFGLSIVNSGAALGTVIAVPLIAWLQIRFGWKTTFVATGLLGFAWLVLWLLVYDDPLKHKYLTVKEKSVIFENSDIETTQESEIKKLTWSELLKRKAVWGIIVARFFGDPVWWLYLLWLPSYLYDVRGFNIKDIGMFAWFPFLLAGIGSLAGGWFSGFLMSKGKSVDFSRKAAILLPTVLMPLGILANYLPDAYQALFAISLVLFGFQFWVNNIQTLPSDYFSSREVGRITGLAQTGAVLGTLVFNTLIGWLVDNVSYTPVLIIGGILGPMATLSIFILGGKIKNIR